MAYSHTRGTTFDLIAPVALPTDTWVATCTLRHGNLVVQVPSVTVTVDTANPQPVGSTMTNYLVELIVPPDQQASWPCDGDLVGKIIFTGASGLVLASQSFAIPVEV